ncbi:MAG: hypothetical protein J0H68_04855 [Sphingobacteriia bacterium]|nr:hypothetical protein [Sphingobacteriia bacterium]
MGKAKTASKNDPTTREKAKDIFYNGKKVKPVRFVSESGSFMAAEDESGNVMTDEEGNPIPWSNITA